MMIRIANSDGDNAVRISTTAVQTLLLIQVKILFRVLIIPR